MADFFLYSLFTFIIAGHKNSGKAGFTLALIYTACLIAAVVEYYVSASFNVVFNTRQQTVAIRKVMYDLAGWTLMIRERKYTLSEYNDSYGLFLQTGEGSPRLVYGYTVRSDIEALKEQLEAHFLAADRRSRPSAQNRLP